MAETITRRQLMAIPTMLGISEDDANNRLKSIRVEAGHVLLTWFAMTPDGQPVPGPNGIATYVERREVVDDGGDDYRPCHEAPAPVSEPRDGSGGQVGTSTDVKPGASVFQGDVLDEKIEAVAHSNRHKATPTRYKLVRADEQHPLDAICPIVPNPLDENDHRPRHCNGDHLYRHPGAKGHWHTYRPERRPCAGRHLGDDLADWVAVGEITFCDCDPDV